MRYIVKDPSGKTVLETVIKQNADQRIQENPEYKLITIPEER